MDFQWLTRLVARATKAPAPLAPGRGCAPRPSAVALRGDAGLLVRTPQAIVDANADLIARLRLHAACDEARFASRYLAPLLRLARHVNVLPATEGGIFCAEMGLFRACLESAFFAFQASDGHIFTGSEGVERRHALEGRWRYVCFLAAMFHPLGRPLERVALAQAEGGAWKQQPGGVTAWAEASGVDRLFVAWPASDEGNAIGPSPLTLPLVPLVVGRDNLQMLEEGSRELVVALHQLAMGEPGSCRIAHDLITSCWDRIAGRDGARRPQVPLAAVAAAVSVPRRVHAPARKVVDVSTSREAPQAPQAAQVAQVAQVPDSPDAPHVSHAPEAGEDRADCSADAKLADPPLWRFAELLPADLRQQIGSNPHSDTLGKIVQAWRERGADSTVMGHTEHGAAIEFRYLTTQVSNVPIWLDAMARCGLVYAPPQTPGLRIHKVSLAEGREPVRAVVLSRLACRRLEL